MSEQRLTPSTLLLLHADRWAGPSAVPAENMQLPRSGQLVGAPQLAEMLMAAAFLANEEARGMELELAAESGLTLHPGEDVPDWPAHSLEHQVWMLMAAGGSCVSDIVYDLLKETPRPGHLVVDYVARSLQGAPVDPLHQPLDPVSALLHRTSKERPALWAELFSEIRTGFDTCRM